jgi:hypothetical protein
MVDDRVPVAVEGLGQQTFSESHPHGVGEALSERSGSRFNAGGDTQFGMSGGSGMQLPEALEFVDGQVVAAQMQQGIDQHRTMSVGQHETVAVDPLRVGRIVFQVAPPEDFGHVGHTHRHSGVAGIRRLDGVDGEKTQCVGAAAAELAGFGGHGNLLQTGHGIKQQDDMRSASARAALLVHQLHDHRREDDLHGQAHLATGTDDDVRPRHERIMQHAQQVGEVDALRVGEADHQHAFVLETEYPGQ